MCMGEREKEPAGTEASKVKHNLILTSSVSQLPIKVRKGEIKNMEECFMRNLKKKNTCQSLQTKESSLASRPRSYGRFKITGH